MKYICRMDVYFQRKKSRKKPLAHPFEVATFMLLPQIKFRSGCKKERAIWNCVKCSHEISRVEFTLYIQFNVKRNIQVFSCCFYDLIKHTAVSLHTSKSHSSGRTIHFFRCTYFLFLGDAAKNRVNESR